MFCNHKKKTLFSTVFSVSPKKRAKKKLPLEVSHKTEKTEYNNPLFFTENNKQIQQRHFDRKTTADIKTEKSRYNRNKRL